MLVLTRKMDESIVIGNSIRVKVLEISGSTVRLGFSAPEDVSIYREEVHNEIAAVNRSAVDEAPCGAPSAEAGVSVVGSR